MPFLSCRTTRPGRNFIPTTFCPSRTFPTCTTLPRSSDLDQALAPFRRFPSEHRSNTALTILIWDNPAHTSQSIFENFHH
jgi:hypothetical protein